MPPEAIITYTTSEAVLAWAPPRGDSGPVVSAITPSVISSRMTSLLRLVAAAERCHLRPALVPGLLRNRRNVPVGGALPSTPGGEDVREAVELLDRGRRQEHPDPSPSLRRLRATPG